VVHVVAAALVAGDGRVLIQRRAPHAHQGGLWEFPGGKLRLDEARWPGLVRELREELGIVAAAGRPLIAVRHAYAGCEVLLDVWRVDAWHGEPRALERQPLRWVTPLGLRRVEMPAADRPVVAALQLPPLYLITPQPRGAVADWAATLTASVSGDTSLVQVRAPESAGADFTALARTALLRLREHRPDARVLLNGPPRLALDLGADGVHLNGVRLGMLDRRPLPAERLVAASCHDSGQLRRAAELGCDFVVLGPVKPTVTHPDAPAMGWDTFAGLVAEASMPVFALGGLAAADLPAAWRAGAQGIAGIRGLWREAGSDPVR
jgi:8-oxo-dGTP diphosphatase